MTKQLPFRLDNTEGFDETDLCILNEAFASLAKGFPGLDGKTIVDALNNAWDDDGQEPRELASLAALYLR